MVVAVKKVVDIENEVEHTAGTLRNHPDFNGKLTVKVCVGLDENGLTIVFGPDNDDYAHIHENLLLQVMGYKPNKCGGSKINLSNQDGQVVAEWTRNRSASLGGPVPDELKEAVMKELQPFLRA